MLDTIELNIHDLEILRSLQDKQMQQDRGIF